MSDIPWFIFGFVFISICAWSGFRMKMFVDRRKAGSEEWFGGLVTPNTMKPIPKWIEPGAIVAVLLGLMFLDNQFISEKPLAVSAQKVLTVFGIGTFVSLRPCLSIFLQRSITHL